MRHLPVDLASVGCRLGLAAALAASLAGCAGPSGPARESPDPSVSPQLVMSTIAPGRTTRVELARAPAKPIVIHFDSGYEVWLYRWDKDSGAVRKGTEVVVLLGPDGVVRKSRLRTG